MQFRVLEVPEWELIRHEFENRGHEMPDPKFAMIVGATNDAGDVLEGFLVCQLQMHMEPLVVYNKYAVRGLVETAEHELLTRLGKTTYYCFTEPDSIAAKLAEVTGSTKVPLQAYQKTLE